MATLVLLTDVTSAAAATNTRNALVNQGHTVTIVDDGLISSHDFSPYDAIVAARPADWSSAQESTIRARINSGQPAILGDRMDGTLNVVRNWTGLSLTGNINSTGASNDDYEIIVTDDTHFITSTLGLGSQVYHDGLIGSFQAVLTATGTAHVGVGLATGDPDHASLTGRKCLIAIEAGTLDLVGNAVGARVVLGGFIYGHHAVYNAVGETLLDRSVRWALGEGVGEPPAPSGRWGRVPIL